MSIWVVCCAPTWQPGAASERDYKHLERAKRKRALTPHCSSRWAGAITRVAGDMWERELLNLEDLESRDRKEIAELDRRLALPVGKGKKKKRGYATQIGAFSEAAPPAKNWLLACPTQRHRLTEGRHLQ